jgi:hypothetical protein
MNTSSTAALTKITDLILKLLLFQASLEFRLIKALKTTLEPACMSSRRIWAVCIISRMASKEQKHACRNYKQC